MRDTFIKALTDNIENFPKTILLTGDLGFGVFDDFAKEYPNNFLNVGVAEQNMAGIAAGLALEGWKVFTYSIANFPTFRCLEQIRNDICYHNLDVTIVSIGGGFSYGALGMSHHATEDIAALSAFPMKVIAPSSKGEVSACVDEMMTVKGPCYLRLDKSFADVTVDVDQEFQIGKAIELCKGEDITIIGYGGIMAEALRAADVLASKNISVRVVSMHTIRPLDKNCIRKCIAETRSIVTIEEHTVSGGLGNAVAAYCLEEGLMPKLFYRIGLRKNEFSSVVGSQKYLRKHYGMSTSDIVNKIESLLGTKQKVQEKSLSHI